METAEVAIIGGGVAGLAALQALRAAGCRALLLEARGRLGGRIWTEHPADWPLPVELGAEFIHGAQPELLPLAPRAAGYGSDWTWSRGKLRAAGEFGGGAWELLGRMQAIRPPAPDRSFADFLASCRDAPPEARTAALGYIEGFEAADPARISVYSLNRERAAEAASDDGGPWPRRPRGGYDRLLRRLGEEESPSDIRLKTVVYNVRWRRGEVMVEAQRASKPYALRARSIIITLPLSVLQRGSVRFDPPLAAKGAPLAQLLMGGALRVTLRLREPFWRGLRDADGRRLGRLRFLFGPAAATGHFPTWWTCQARGGAQITGWAAGRHAWALERQSPGLLRRRALADLSERAGLPPRALAQLVISTHAHDWQADPFSLGAYSYAGVGGADAFAALAAPLTDTLFFAGEATDSQGHHATVHGAVRSGRRAAGEVLRR